MTTLEALRARRDEAVRQHDEATSRLAEATKRGREDLRSVALIAQTRYRAMTDAYDDAVRIEELGETTSPGVPAAVLACPAFGSVGEGCCCNEPYEDCPLQLDPSLREG